jgi:hypothetical protein
VAAAGLGGQPAGSERKRQQRRIQHQLELGNVGKAAKIAKELEEVTSANPTEEVLDVLHPPEDPPDLLSAIAPPTTIIADLFHTADPAPPTSSMHHLPHMPDRHLYPGITGLALELRHKGTPAWAPVDNSPRSQPMTPTAAALGLQGTGYRFRRG